jgi:hypothetical protein
VLHVPYKGAGPATTAVLAGEGDLIRGDEQRRQQSGKEPEANGAEHEIKRPEDASGHAARAQDGFGHE